MKKFEILAIHIIIKFMAKKHELKEVTFVTSAVGIKDSPKADKPEYGFIGRSNVGKSTLINMLTQNKGLARVSGTPGKTQLINYFLVDQSWYMVDLPGYGYAKTSRKNRFTLSRMIEEYIEKRTSLSCMFVLIDSRHKPMESDLAFMRWLGENGVPFGMVFTKIDKLSTHKLQANITAYQEEMKKEWAWLPDQFFTSSKNYAGRDELLVFINKTNKIWEQS